MEMLSVANICRGAEHLTPLESQREYRQRIAAFIRMHTARLRAMDNGVSFSALPINSMLIIAQTGCGKSYTAARLCESAGVELVTIDCSTLTKSGYKGCNLSDMIYAAKSNSGNKFQDTIILFDEVDKMRIDSIEGNPQSNFLKLFDGIMQVDPRGSSPATIDLTRVSFLFAGAFSGLEDIIRRRLTPRSIGFSTKAADPSGEKDLLSLATMEDIRNYGFMEELLGRIGSLLYVPPLTPADYRMLLKGSTQTRYSNLFATSGVSLTISDSACDCIAREASRSAMGARAVEPMVYGCLQNAFQRLDSDETINRVTLSCRNGRLALTYGHGERSLPKEKEDPVVFADVMKLPDVSIAHYLDSDENVKLLCEMALCAFNRPNTGKELRLKAFLLCCLRYMRTLQREEDKVLSSLTKLANATKPDRENDSCFDRIITERLQYKGSHTEDWEKLSEAYNVYASYRSEKNHIFWVEATKELRRKWYESLIRKAC